MKKTFLKIGAGLIIILALAIIGFIIWGSTPAAPMPEAMAALQSDSTVSVENGEFLTFTPLSQQPTTGFIFYPGGRVDYRAYAPEARQIASKGYQVVIVPMPLSLAVLGAGKATDVIKAYPQIKHWAIGGHSLGGAMAANFAKQHPGAVQGLIFTASYPAPSDDLSQSGLKVVSIFGSLDGLATGPKIDASRALLPSDTTWVKIDGGNHAQFGWYGPQSGDNPATLQREAQTKIVVDASAKLLSELQGVQ